MGQKNACRRCSIQWLIGLMLLLGAPQLALAAAAVASAQAKRFIIRIEVPPGFSTLPEQLLTVVEENLPNAILARRGYIYDNRDNYKELRHVQRDAQDQLNDPDVIDEFLRSRDLHFILVLSLSSTPLPNNGLLLTGRLIDVDALKTIIKECLRKASSKCSLDFSSARAISLASGIINNIPEIHEKLQNLFAKILHIPVITMDTTAPLKRLYRPWDTIEFGVWVETNVGNESLADTAARREYGYKVTSISISEAKGIEFCRNPEQFWPQLLNDAQQRRKSRAYRPTLDSEVELIEDKKVKKLPAAVSSRINSKISLSTTPGDSDILFRVVAVNYEQGPSGDETSEPIEVESSPIYRCAKVRDIRNYFGLTMKYAFFSHSIPANGIREYSSEENISLDFSYSRRFEDGVFTVRPLYGLTSVKWTSTCAGQLSPSCEATPRVSKLSAHELRLRFELRPYSWRLGKFGIFEPRVLLDLGLGFENVTSEPAYLQDGWRGVAMLGVGVQGTITFGPQLGGIGKTHLGLLWQARIPFNGPQTPDPSMKNAVEQLMDPTGNLWLLWSIDFGFY